MIGVASLDLVAWPVRYVRRLIVAVLDARRGEVFHASYRTVPGGLQRISDYSVSTPEELASDLALLDDECLLVGDGAIRYQDVFRELHHHEVAEQGMAHPSAASLVQLAHARALREEFVKPWEIEPLYLRQPDAEINWASRHP